MNNMNKWTYMSAKSNRVRSSNINVITIYDRQHADDDDDDNDDDDRSTTL